MVETTTNPVAQEVPVEVVSGEAFAENGLDTAISCLERVQRSLLKSIEFFREPSAPDAHQFFIRCLEGLERFLQTVTSVRKVLKLDLSQYGVEGISLAQMEQDLLAILKGILDCQEKKDLIGIADKIEYELLTNLSLWRSGLNQLRLSRQPEL